MGVCGYTYDQVNAMPMFAIERAIGARHKLINSILRCIFGEEPGYRRPAMVRNGTGLEDIDAMFSGKR